MDDIPARLQRLMQANDVSAGALASAAGCTPELVYRWLNGSRRITDTKLQRVAEYFGVNAAHLKYGTSTVDADALADITAGLLSALEDIDAVTLRMDAGRIGHLVAWAYDQHTTHGAPPSAESYRQILQVIAGDLRGPSHRG